MRGFNFLLIILFLASCSCDRARIKPSVFDWASKLCAPNGGIHELSCWDFNLPSGCKTQHFDEVKCNNGAIFYKDSK